MAAVQKSELVLITGGTGWIGSHIVDQALKHGLAIRLAIRNEAKAQKLVKAMKEVHGDNVHIELVQVDDFSAADAYDEAIKGVHGVIHAASDLSFSDKWDEVVDTSLKGYSAILAAAHRTPSVKRVVLTSSSTAAGVPNVNGKEAQHFDASTWNEKSTREAKTNPNSMNIYASSKVVTEQYVWDYVKKQKPDFVVNTVLPNMCLGRKVPGSDYLSTGTWMRDVVIDGKPDRMNSVAPQYGVDVDDVAILHILALTDPAIKDERILAFSERFTWHQVLELGKKYLPNNKLPAEPETAKQYDNTTVDLTRAQELLKNYGGLKSLDHMIKLNWEVAA